MARDATTEATVDTPTRHSALVAAVRERLPLPRRSGIKIREVDGRTGLAQMPDSYADAIIVDAFAGAVVPAELATAEFFADVARVLRAGGLMAMNLGDRSPFATELALQGASLKRAPDLVRRLGVLGTLCAAFDLPIRASRDPYIKEVCRGLGLIEYAGEVGDLALRRS